MKKKKIRVPKFKMPLIKLPRFRKKKPWEKSDEELIKKEEKERKQREKTQKRNEKKKAKAKKEKKAKKDKEKKPKRQKIAASQEAAAKKKLPLKKVLPAFLVVIAGVLALATFLPDSFWDGAVGFGADVADPELLDAAVIEALLSEENAEAYMGGECPAEGHIVLGSEKTEDGNIKAYLLTMTGFYGFIDDYFVKISGSDTIPAVFTFADGQNGYRLLKMDFPLGGSAFEPSIQAMFPEKYLDRVMAPAEEDIEDLIAQERKYAEAYLTKIGRHAEIGYYEDFNILLLREAGIPVEITNFIAESKDLSLYPYWIGTRESVEDEVRYTYSTDFDQDDNRIIMKKYNSDIPDALLEHIEIDSVTREMKIF